MEHVKRLALYVGAYAFALQVYADVKANYNQKKPLSNYKASVAVVMLEPCSIVLNDI